MKHVSTSVIALLIVTVPLGACSSVLGLRFGPRAATSVKDSAASGASDAKVKRMSITEEGRRHLEAGAVGLAVESFQKALGNGEAMGPALNGLAVAYARLGRDDLALRLFQQAIAAEPQNASYTENLNTLLASQARRNNPMISAPAGIHAIAPLNYNQPSGALQRVSRGEVRIVTVPAQARPQKRQDPRIEKFKPLIRIEFARLTIKAEDTRPSEQLQQQ